VALALGFGPMVADAGHAVCVRTDQMRLKKGQKKPDLPRARKINRFVFRVQRKWQRKHMDQENRKLGS
jgi:hypothetical protein